MIKAELLDSYSGGCLHAMETGERLAGGLNTLPATYLPNDRRNALDYARHSLNSEKTRLCAADLIIEAGRIVVSCPNTLEECGYKSMTDGVFRPYR